MTDWKLRLVAAIARALGVATVSSGHEEAATTLDRHSSQSVEPETWIADETVPGGYRFLEIPGRKYQYFVPPSESGLLRLGGTSAVVDYSDPMRRD